MLLSRNFTISFDQAPERTLFPFQSLLDRWVEVGFEPKRSHAILLDLIEKQVIDPQLVVPDAIFRQGEPFLGRKLLYPDNLTWSLRMGVSGHPGASVLIEPVERSIVPEIAAFTAWALRTSDRTKLTERLTNLQKVIPIDALLLAENDTYANWPKREGPGIFRREHASLHIQSETTRILFDPIFANRTLPNMSLSPIDREPDFDGVFITHSHGDHWHLPTLLAVAGDGETPVYVPRVPKVNLLTPTPLYESLKASGINGQIADWDTTIKIGDIEIDILPFFGEQPSREEWGVPKDVRNWGNCFRVTTPQFSVLILVDSGIDPLGDVREAVAASTRKRGQPSALLACGRTFFCPFFGGLSNFFGAIPFSSLTELYRQYEAKTLPSVTAGSKGLAEACAASGAAHFLPYANGFEAPGKPVTDIGWGQGEISEKVVLAEIASHLRANGGKTNVQAWNPGDWAVFEGERLKIIPFSTPPK